MHGSLRALHVMRHARFAWNFDHSCLPQLRHARPRT